MTSGPVGSQRRILLRSSSYHSAISTALSSAPRQAATAPRDQASTPCRRCRNSARLRLPGARAGTWRTRTRAWRATRASRRTRWAGGPGNRPSLGAAVVRHLDEDDAAARLAAIDEAESQEQREERQIDLPTAKPMSSAEAYTIMRQREAEMRGLEPVRTDVSGLQSTGSGWIGADR
jgi:hypothetical protein